MNLDTHDPQTAIANEQRRLNEASPLPVPNEPVVDWDDLTWWEKRQRARTALLMRRAEIKRQRVRDRAELARLRQNEMLGWFGRTNEVRLLAYLPGGLWEVIGSSSIVDGWAKTHDGKRVKLVPNSVGYLKQSVKAGPILLYGANDPMPLDPSRAPQGLTDEMLLALPGGGLRNALQAGNKDGLALGKAGKVALIGLLAVGLVAAIGWLWSRGFFG